MMKNNLVHEKHEMHENKPIMWAAAETKSTRVEIEMREYALMKSFVFFVFLVDDSPLRI